MCRRVEVLRGVVTMGSEGWSALIGSRMADLGYRRSSTGSMMFVRDLDRERQGVVCFGVSSPTSDDAELDVLPCMGVRFRAVAQVWSSLDARAPAMPVAGCCLAPDIGFILRGESMPYVPVVADPDSWVLARIVEDIQSAEDVLYPQLNTLEAHLGAAQGRFGLHGPFVVPILLGELERGDEGYRYAQQLSDSVKAGEGPFDVSESESYLGFVTRFARHYKVPAPRAAVLSRKPAPSGSGVDATSMTIADEIESDGFTPLGENAALAGFVPGWKYPPTPVRR